MGTLSSTKPDTGRTFTYTLVVYGSDPSSTDIALKTGWNLVSFPSVTQQVLPDTYSLHSVTIYSLVTTYLAMNTADPWNLNEPSESVYTRDLGELTPGLVYLIQVDADANWNIPY